MNFKKIYFGLTISLFSIFFSNCATLYSSRENNFRDVPWNETIDNVILIKGKYDSFIGEITDYSGIIYENKKIFNYNCFITYYFDDNKLFEILYGIDNKNYKECQIIFNKIYRQLLYYFGKPSYPRGDFFGGGDINNYLNGYTEFGYEYVWENNDDIIHLDLTNYLDENRNIESSSLSVYLTENESDKISIR